MPANNNSRVNDTATVAVVSSHQLTHHGGPSSTKPDCHQGTAAQTAEKVARRNAVDSSITQPVVNCDDMGLKYELRSAEHSGDAKHVVFDETNHLASSQKKVLSPVRPLTHESAAMSRLPYHTALPAADLPCEVNSQELPVTAKLHYFISQSQTVSIDERPGREEAAVEHKPFHFRVNLLVHYQILLRSSELIVFLFITAFCLCCLPVISVFVYL